MQTDAFPDGGIVPQKFAGRGGVQPGFKFTGAPEGTVSYAIIFHDIDVALQGGTGDVLHWIAWNIPASAGGIPEGKLPEGSVQGANITGQNVYFGPGAPNGPRYHHYVFELYALNAMLDLPATAGRGGVQPGFKFTGAPEGTVSYAIIFHDIDVALQGGTGDVLHWLAWNIPASAGGIPEGKLPEGLSLIHI